MRRAALALLLFASCATPPAPVPAPAPAPEKKEPYGLTLDEEAQVLRLEDRREYDAKTASGWIHHENPLHRARMALALGRIGAHTFVDANGNGVRDAGEKQAGVDELASLVSDPSDPVRINAAFGLGQIGDAAGVDALLKFANDADGTVATEAVEALSRLAPASVKFAQYAPFLAANQREGVRARAIRFLFRFKSDEASSVAASALDATSPAIRQEAAYALARRAYAPARERLELLLTDPDPQTRAYATTALGRIGSPASLPALLNTLSDAHPWVRTNGVVAIGRVLAKDASALNADDGVKLIAITSDPDAGTRANAAETLGYYAAKNEAARKRLLEIAANGSRWEREIATGAIAKHLDDEKLLPSDMTGWMKLRVLESGGKTATAMRAKWLNDPDPLVRENALGAIGEDEADAQLDVIRKALSDPDVIVRSRAIDRLSKVKKIDVKPELRAFEQAARKDSQNDARLAAIGGLSTDEAFLRTLLADSDPVVRRNAADAIEKLGKPRPQFTPLAADADYKAIAEWSRAPHTATIHMTRGTIEIKLLPQDAPMTAWNFAQLAKKHYFDNTTFMRVVPNFVIQGGDPRNDQEGGPGYAIRDEINLQKYTRGAVGMALSGPDTGGSQFFITHSPQPHLDAGYTIFGRVENGMSGVVDHTERGDRVESITVE